MNFHSTKVIIKCYPMHSSQISLLSAVRIAHTASLAITSSRSPIYIVYSISRGECNCKCNMADIPSCRSIYTPSVTHIYHICRANKPMLGNVYGDFQCGFVTSGCGAPSRRQYRTQLGIGDGWRFSVAVTRWSRSTQLLYIEPG